MSSVQNVVSAPLTFQRSRCLLALGIAGVALTTGFGQTPPPPPAPPTAVENQALLSLHKWSGEINVPDPVACDVDPQGRVYVTSTTRRRVADLEIRQYPTWVASELALTSVEEKSAFLHQALPPNNPRPPRTDIKDLNGDGSIDWKDLTVPSERIYQLRDTNGDGTADKITVFAEGFSTDVTGVAAGVLYHDGWVYATIAPDLWRFKDTNDDGVADVRELLIHGFGVHIGYGGHDMHGLVPGLDGRIYWSIGDKGVNVTTKEGRHFFYPNEGAVLRMDPDGSNFEVYAHGLRNTQEPAFDEFGDLIGVDNDADMEGERERFVYIPEGSDSGWRQNHQFMGLRSVWMREGLWKPPFSGQPSYFLPPISNYSDGPGGFKHDPGTALNDQLRGIYLLNEFPSGKMRGFRVERDGASFKMVDPGIYHEGIMGVGMSWHPDGSLMMVDWLAGWALKGAGVLWKVDAATDAHTAIRQETQRLLTAGFGARNDDELIGLLSHRDQRVRLGGQVELAKRGKSAALLHVAQDGQASLLARVHAIWGYGQLIRRGAADMNPAIELLKDADAEIRTQVARILGDVPPAKIAATALIPLLADESPRVRRETAIALGKSRSHAAVAPLLAMVEKDFDAPVLRHAAVSGLTGCADDTQLAANKNSPSRSVRMASIIALRRQASPKIAEFLHDADELVVAEAALGIHDDFSIPEAMPALAALLGAAPHSENITRRIINANLRLGTTESAGRLLAFALDGAAAMPMRQEALTCLRLWPAPESIDRVDGHSRKIRTVAIANVLSPKLDALLGLNDPGLKTLGIEIMIAHSLQASPTQIASIVKDPAAPGPLRAQALRLLAGEGKATTLSADVLNVALAADAPAPLHRAALALTLERDPDRFLREARTVLDSRSVPEQQHALSLLAKAASPSADAMLTQYADQLVGGQSAPALQLDVIEALRARSAANPTFKARLASYESSAPAAAHTELLTGGSADAGSEIVQNNLNANCLSCHSITPGGGSAVGPNLRFIGSHRDPAYLVESLIVPSAKIATGYGVVSVTLKDKTSTAGTLASESPESITLRLFDGNRRTIPRDTIAEQTAAMSVMPPMLGVLQPREIRDVVAYLSSLKEKRVEARSGEGE
ncbi:MAG: HEAT repeat domain-containing protein [Opitutus sp.]